MSDEGWVEVKNTKRQRRQEKQEAAAREVERWDVLRTRAPHIVTPARAQRIRRKLNILNLDEKLVSKEWVDHQLQGWEYQRVVKPDDGEGIPDNTDTDVYSTLPLDNGYGDVVLFRMAVSVGEDEVSDE